MLIELGLFTFIMSFSIAVFQVIVFGVGIFFKEQAFFKLSIRSNLLIFFLILFSFFTLLYAYIVSDFSVLNVAENSYSEKPLFFKISALWANHEGSMLLWVFLLAAFLFIIMWKDKFSSQEFKATVLACHSFCIGIFVFFILFFANPFKRAFPVPLQGKGLNPLLQDYALAFHPPLLYIGYAALAVCFSYLSAGLIKNKLDREWLFFITKWVKISWIFLTLGIFIGAYWAYYELGWGGYWSWDPVENSSLLPWLSATALLHILPLWEKREAGKNFTIALIILSFFFVLLTLALVRSGLLASLHSFAINPMFGIAFAVVVLILIMPTFILWLRRWPSRADKLYTLFSKENFLFVAQLLFVLAMIIVFLGISSPILYELCTGRTISIAASYYSSTLTPLSFIGFLFMGASYYVFWGKGNSIFFCKRILLALILSLSLVFLFFYGKNIKDYSFVFLLFSSVFVLIIVALLPVFERSISPIYKIFVSNIKAISHTRINYAVTFSHAGGALIALSVFLVSHFEKEKNFILKPGDIAQIGNVSLYLKKIDYKYRANYREQLFTFVASKAPLSLNNSYKNSAAKRDIIEAAIRYFPWQKLKTTEVGLRRYGLSQIYITPMGERQEGYAFAVWWKPYIILLWLGGAFFVLAGCISIYRRSSKYI